MNENNLKNLISTTKFNLNKPSIDTDTPLIIACRKNNEAIIHFLIKYKVDVDMTNREHDNPLLIACIKRNGSIIEYISYW